VSAPNALTFGSAGEFSFASFDEARDCWEGLIALEWRAFFAGYEVGIEAGREAPPIAMPLERPAECVLAEGANDLVHSFCKLGHCT